MINLIKRKIFIINSFWGFIKNINIIILYPTIYSILGKVMFILSKRQKPKLVFLNYSYYKHRESKKKTVWRSKLKICQGKIHTENVVDAIFASDRNHETIAEEEIVKIKFYDNLNRKACNTRENLYKQ